MAEMTGFTEYLRELPADRMPLERIHDWREFHLHMDDKRVSQQAARCMDCGVPFCHSGKLRNGSASGCPVDNLIPDWNELVSRGLWREALERLNKTNNFPEFTGRVCPAPCEESCLLGVGAPPVTIKNVENSIIDKGWNEGWVLPGAPAQRTGKTIAIVGSGPAGLAAAAQLNHAGHIVTVFEREDRPGGLLMYGIPNMKLDKRQVVMRRIKLMEDAGVKFLCGANVGTTVDPRTLRRDFDAVVLCTGATVPRDLSIDGRNLGGVHFAMDYLTASTKALLNGSPEDAPVHAKDKDVVVIGGGDTGTDCVATAIRQGCRSVTQFEIMPEPPRERANDSPWPDGPKLYRMDYGQEEAAARFGVDPRAYLTTVKKFVGDVEGGVARLSTVKIGWEKGADGRLRPMEVAASEESYPAQLVLLAMGFLGPEPQLVLDLGLQIDARTNVDADYGKFATSAPGVFAAGDCRRGQSLVVWAINEGRAAARECDRYLMGTTNLP
jgi:glutamate synthase (NADPH/NADH) small chain